MPRGDVWPREATATQTAALSGLMPTYERQNAAAAGLLVDAFPSTTDYLLPEWNQTLGLPDAQAGAAPTLALAQQQVVAKFANGGGQSINYYTQYAAQFGFTISVQPLAAFRAGQSRAGQQLGKADWVYVWNIKVKSISGAYAAWQTQTLVNQLAAMAPAHMILQISYD